EVTDQRSEVRAFIGAVISMTKGDFTPKFCGPTHFRKASPFSLFFPPPMGGRPSMPRSDKLRPIVSRASRNAAQPAAPVRTAADVPQMLTIDVSEQTVFDRGSGAAPVH